MKFFSLSADHNKANNFKTFTVNLDNKLGTYSPISPFPASKMLIAYVFDSFKYL